MSLLEVQNVKKTYTARFGGVKVEALKNVNFSVEKGEYVAIMGESGSGKTTLLNILASLDRPTGGRVILEGKQLNEVPDRELCAFRRDCLGFVFQDFNLLDTLSLKDNIFLPLVLAGRKYEFMEAKLRPLAPLLGIEDLLEKYPYEVSGGEKQRAAAARALITDPKLLLADEPTGALDSAASDRLLSLFSQVNESGQTILMVTHSIQAASHAGRVLFLKDGILFHQIYRGERSREEMYKAITDSLTVLQSGKSGTAGMPMTGGMLRERAMDGRQVGGTTASGSSMGNTAVHGRLQERAAANGSQVEKRASNVSLVEGAANGAQTGRWSE